MGEEHTKSVAHQLQHNASRCALVQRPKSGVAPARHQHAKCHTCSLRHPAYTVSTQERGGIYTGRFIPQGSKLSSIGLSAICNPCNTAHRQIEGPCTQAGARHAQPGTRVNPCSASTHKTRAGTSRAATSSRAKTPAAAIIRVPLHSHFAMARCFTRRTGVSTSYCPNPSDAAEVAAVTSLSPALSGSASAARADKGSTASSPPLSSTA